MQACPELLRKGALLFITQKFQLLKCEKHWRKCSVIDTTECGVEKVNSELIITKIPWYRMETKALLSTKFDISYKNCNFQLLL